MSEPAFERTSAILHDLLRRAGRMALDHQSRAVATLKEDGSPVTEADKAIDAFLDEHLVKLFPGMGVLGEEGADSAGPRGVFHVDPIDGTDAFLQRLAYWGPTVSAVVGGKLAFGAFYAPALDEFWFVSRGEGAWRNGVRLPPITEDLAPRRQVVFVPSRFHQGPRVGWPGKVRALGSTAAHLAHVAAGAGVATIVPRWSLWDVGSGALMIEEVGGRICGVDGADVDLVHGPVGLPFLAGAPTALKLLVEQTAGRIDVGR